MGFFEALIRTLIYLALIALCFFLTVWVLAEIGLVLPYMVITILKVIFILIDILVLARLIWPFISGYEWFPPRRPPGQ